MYYKKKLAYILKTIKNRWNDKAWIHYQFCDHILRSYYDLQPNNGIYVTKEKWNNLIILDACRYDIFEEALKKENIKGKLYKKTSRGSATPQFLKENFKGKKLKNIIYVTANPFVHTKLDNPFYKTINVWKNMWDEENKTIPPEKVVKTTIMTHIKHPDKKLIVHFMQPHVPFIGPNGTKGNFWRLAYRKGIKKVEKMYRENLEIVIPHVKKLIKKLHGTTIITSDHGNALGEKAVLGIKIYGHPNGVRIPALIEVPWFEAEAKK